MNVLRETFSGSSEHLSSKRIMGAISYLTILGCAIYLVINEGATNSVADILQTLIFMSAALLGMDSVTGIWKRKVRGPRLPDPPENEEIKKEP